VNAGVEVANEGWRAGLFGVCMVENGYVGETGECLTAGVKFLRYFEPPIVLGEPTDHRKLNAIDLEYSPYWTFLGFWRELFY
jgi:hypothetical protein